MIWYLWHLKDIERICEEFKREVVKVGFTDYKRNEILSTPTNLWYCWTPRYQEYWQILWGIVDTCDMLGIQSLEEKKSILVERMTFLNTPESITYRSYFEAHVDFVKNSFKDVEKDLKEKLQLLDEEEAIRLNEALNCYIQGCNYSAITMSVSAIEFRLLNLMQSVKPNPQLEEYTLGQLIAEYLKNKREYKNVIPEKHEHLLKMSNTYRIFSVHPKKEKITRPIATSIINMTFAFLLDEELKFKAKK
jgi:hypothetical protein